MTPVGSMLAQRSKQLGCLELMAKDETNATKYSAVSCAAGQACMQTSAHQAYGAEQTRVAPAEHHRRTSGAGAPLYTLASLSALCRGVVKVMTGHSRPLWS
jgi:hypothetical protein